MKWETVVGLEIHVQLNTKTKIFSPSPNEFGAVPNTNVCEIDLGFPGALPSPNKEAVAKATKLGLALEATVNRRSIFERKNYFYPDLPKAYQISQMAKPIIERGKISIACGDGFKDIEINNAHLEEDAGKSVHEGEGLGHATGIDLNRTGTPLIEIVSEPQMRSAQEAVAYAKAMHGLVRWLGICDGDMSQGNFRIDANVSVRPEGASEFGTRTETKNLNSFHNLEQAIEYETRRQIDVIESGARVVQETRLFDADKCETRAMRSKEDAHDYRYFPDPDLPVVEVSDEMLRRAQSEMPELPNQMAQRLQNDLGLSAYDAHALTSDKETAEYFQACVERGADPKLSANWMNGELAARLNKEGMCLSRSPIQADRLSGLVARVSDGTLSNKLAKKVFDSMWDDPSATADSVIDKQGLRQITDEGAIVAMVEQAIAANPKSVEEYRAGKEKALNAIVGQVMKLSKGKANPARARELTVKKLKEGE